MSALSKGFQILETTAGAAEGLTFSEIVAATDLPKASVHRLLRELVELDALDYDDSSRRYRGGLALAALGASVAANYDIRRVARPFLERLHEKTGLVATLGIRNGDVGTYIDKIEPAGLIVRLHSEIGKSFPLHCTAMGKVLLANSDAATITRVTRRQLQQFTPNTITEGKALRRELEEVAANGYALDREEITRGLICVAAPILGLDGQVVAAMSCTMSSFDATDELLEQNRANVLECASAAS